MNRSIDALRGIAMPDRATWLVTGAAGFIGSNLVETLLRAGQVVVGLDNFATGYRRNLAEVEALVGSDTWARFSLIEADIRDADACRAAVAPADYVLHQAALGSVPRSLADPLTTHAVNVTGFLNMLDAARHTQSRGGGTGGGTGGGGGGVRGFVYAASSSTYGDEPNLPKREDRIGNPLSPYAVTKLADELYAAVYARSYGLASVGLRYFNVFGPRQDPDGAYAAVIPKWTAAMIAGDAIRINGDGETSRDFCYVANAVQANVRAALTPTTGAEIYNVAVGDQTSLLGLFGTIRDGLAAHQIAYHAEPVFAGFRAGDVRHSLADISKARERLGFAPTHRIAAGIAEALPWYIAAARQRGPN